MERSTPWPRQEPFWLLVELNRRVDPEMENIAWQRRYRCFHMAVVNCMREGMHSMSL